ncbi:uncharacterized protein LOC101452583 [Ceratitis capitata]|uniref:uncharacterized protein LOC101452583 n=1 Tax=Ceratitis capitata TaxID=7213 RepID=UPI00032A0DF9|nr:uncharacterized protein LOC101452583 [Ceratitis capitata]
MSTAARLIILVLIAYTAMQPFTTNADTKVLNILSLNQPGFGSRYEVISLENVGTPEEELVVKGNRTTELGPPNSEGLIIMEITEFTADKTGYHAHTRIVAIPAAETRLSPGALMSAAG